MAERLRCSSEVHARWRAHVEIGDGILSVIFNASNLDVEQHVPRPCNLQLVHKAIAIRF